MREGRYLYLILAAVVAAIAAIWASHSRAPATDSAAATLLMPGLAAAVNEISKITATGPGDLVVVTLEKGEAAWTVTEQGGYPADPAKVRKFLLDLAAAALVEQKTSRAENYAKLGVEAVAAEDAGGVQIALTGAANTPVVVIGKTARGGNASYVRVADQTPSWVADKKLTFSVDAGSWLNKDIMDVDSARITRVQVRHPDGASVDATRGAVNFALANVPAGKTLNSPAAANSLANVLDGLRFEDVVAQAVFEAGDDAPVEVTYETSDGLLVDAKAYANGENYYASFASRFDASVTELLPSPDADETGEPTVAPGVDPEVAQAAREESERINARVSGWVYKIPQYKYQQMTRTIDDFIKDVE